MVEQRYSNRIKHEDGLEMQVASMSHETWIEFGAAFQGFHRNLGILCWTFQSNSSKPRSAAVVFISTGIRLALRVVHGYFSRNFVWFSPIGCSSLTQACNERTKQYQCEDDNKRKQYGQCSFSPIHSDFMAEKIYYLDIWSALAVSPVRPNTSNISETVRALYY